MLNHKIVLACACMSVAVGLSFAGQAVADDAGKPTDMNRATVAQETPLLPAGITAKDLNSDKGIEKAFKAVTEDSLNKTGFDNLVGRLVEQDRDRIKKSINTGSLNNINGSKNQALVDIIGTLQGDWKNKYNHSFDIDYSKVFTPEYVHIQTGEVADADQLVGMWPVNVTLPDRDMKNTTDTGGKLTQADADRTKAKMFGGEIKLEKGRNVAVARFAASSYFGGLNASMIHEVGGWKFDIPNNIDAQKLYDNLVNNLTMVEREHAKWPDDINDGYRHVGAAVVAALYDAPYPGNIMRPSAPGAAMAR